MSDVATDWAEESLKLDSKTTIRKSVEVLKRPMQLIQLNRGLSLRQQRFFNLAILKVDNGVSEISASDYKEIFSDDTDHFYSNAVIDDIEKLISLSIQTITEKKIIWDNVFLRVEYDKELNKYSFVWSPYMKERIENVRRNYIQQDLKTLAKFKNKYSFIWYDYFKSNYRQYRWPLSKEEVINLLQVQSKKSYLEHHSMFYKQCIQAPIDELNEHTEFKIDVSFVKKGRAVQGYEFVRRVEKNVEVGVTEKQLNTLREIVDRYNDTQLMMREISNIALSNAESAKELTELFFDLQNLNRFIAAASDFTSEGYKDVVALAIKKDNRFKKILQDVREYMSSNPTIDMFIEESELTKEPKRNLFYNWLDERE